MELKKEEFENLSNERNRLAQQISISIETITPELARKFLLKNLGNPNIKNRTPHKRTVNSYVSDILNQRWKVGVPIIFDTDDNLIDGKHRCLAIIKSDKPINSLILRGVDSNIFDSLDIGKKRTHKDALSTLVFNRQGLVDPVSVSAAINIMRSIGKNHTAIDKNRGMITNPEMIQIVNNDFSFYDEPFLNGKNSKIFIWRNNIKLAIPKSIFACFYYLNKKLYGKVVDEFLTTITSSNNNTPPVVREFRDMIIYNKGKKSDEKGYLPPIAVFRLIDILFKYNLEKGTLSGRKHISKPDLQKINE